MKTMGKIFAYVIATAISATILAGCGEKEEAGQPTQNTVKKQLKVQGMNSIFGETLGEKPSKYNYDAIKERSKEVMLPHPAKPYEMFKDFKTPSDECSQGYAAHIDQDGNIDGLQYCFSLVTRNNEAVDTSRKIAETALEDIRKRYGVPLFEIRIPYTDILKLPNELVKIAYFNDGIFFSAVIEWRVSKESANGITRLTITSMIKRRTIEKFGEIARNIHMDREVRGGDYAVGDEKAFREAFEKVLACLPEDVQAAVDKIAKTKRTSW